MSMRAFTLIEVLIYFALFSILITGVLASMVELRSGADRIDTSARLTDEGHFILERLQHGEPIAPSTQMTDWERSVRDDGSIEISFTLTATTKAGNPLSFPFYATFLPSLEP